MKSKTMKRITHSHVAAVFFIILSVFSAHAQSSTLSNYNRTIVPDGLISGEWNQDDYTYIDETTNHLTTQGLDGQKIEGDRNDDYEELKFSLTNPNPTGFIGDVWRVKLWFNGFWDTAPPLPLTVSIYTGTTLQKSVQFTLTEGLDGYSSIGEWYSMVWYPPTNTSISSSVITDLRIGFKLPNMTSGRTYYIDAAFVEIDSVVDSIDLATTRFQGSSNHITSAEYMLGKLNDVNADGYDDLGICYSRVNFGSNYGPQAYILPGTNQSLPATVALPGNYFRFQGIDDTWKRGIFGMFGIGDINGDGKDDISFGGPHHYDYSDPITEPPGIGYVHYGSTSWGGAGSGALFGGSALFDGDQPGANLGWVFSKVGDFYDADGKADFVVTAPNYSISGSGTDEGGLFIVKGGSIVGHHSIPFSGISPIAVGGTQVLERYGQEAKGVGDVNGDGFDDFVIGVPFVNNASGKIVLVLGGNSPSAKEIHSSAVGPAHLFGSSISYGGDVNGDGYSDFLVHADGSLYVFFGRPGGVNAWPDYDWQANSSFNIGITHSNYSFFNIIGDINDDGFDDLAIGGISDQVRYPNGAFLLFFGRPAGNWWTIGKGMGDSADAVIDVPMVFFDDIVPIGDFDDDGVSDFCVSNHRWNGNRGEVFLFLGKDF